MKKFLIALFALLAAVAVCACGGNTDKTSENGGASAPESSIGASVEETSETNSVEISEETSETESVEIGEEPGESEEEGSEKESSTSEWVDIEFPRPQ